MLTFSSLSLVQPYVSTMVPNGAGHTSHTDSSGQFRRLCHVSSYTPVVPACCIHSLSARLSLPCPCTFCILQHRLPSCLSIFTLMSLVLNTWSCDSVKNSLFSSSDYLMPATASSVYQQLCLAFVSGSDHEAVLLVLLLLLLLMLLPLLLLLATTTTTTM